MERERNSKYHLTVKQIVLHSTALSSRNQGVTEIIVYDQAHSRVNKEPKSVFPAPFTWSCLFAAPPVQIRGGHGWAVLHQLWTNIEVGAQQDTKHIVCRKGGVPRTCILYKGSTEIVMVYSGPPCPCPLRCFLCALRHSLDLQTRCDHMPIVTVMTTLLD